MQRKFKISYTPRSEKELEKFRKKHWKSYRDYMAILPALEADPYGVGKLLRGQFKGLYSLHFGRSPECRAIYEIKNDLVIVVILRIGTRENFYNLF